MLPPENLDFVDGRVIQRYINAFPSRAQDSVLNRLIGAQEFALDSDFRANCLRKFPLSSRRPIYKRKLFSVTDRVLKAIAIAAATGAMYPNMAAGSNKAL